MLFLSATFITAVENNLICVNLIFVVPCPSSVLHPPPLKLQINIATGTTVRPLSHFGDLWRAVCCDSRALSHPSSFYLFFNVTATTASYSSLSLINILNLQFVLRRRNNDLRRLTLNFVQNDDWRQNQNSIPGCISRVHHSLSWSLLQSSFYWMTVCS